MIAIDTSSFVAYLSGDNGEDVLAVDLALGDQQAVLPPVVLTELLSDPHLSPSISELFTSLPLLELTPGFWERAGTLRSKILKKGLKARIADALIAQACIDHEIALISRDADFRHYVRWGGLTLL
ncbi:MAG: PIN domain-containing protein [Deltaproteobacteria bacterium]|nr:PIN domain-containing protein [Deltaproteobacteria bacterium]